MKTVKKHLQLTRSMGLFAMGVVTIFLFLSSCDKGRDGRPGRAYLALEWEVDRPNLVDAGTPDIPPVFEWGRSYRAYAGWYSLYYEGRMWNGYTYANYAWEVDYEIWYESGDRGGYSYDGRDGRDNYFTLVCSPYGPIVDRFTMKNLPVEGNKEITALEDGSFEVVTSTGDMGMRAIYRPVAMRAAL